MIPEQELFAPGHNACAGCGPAAIARLILKATGDNIIVVSPTGCLETFSSLYDLSSWEVPWMHPLFENGASVASGVEAALRILGKADIPVIVIGGDGGTYDIGMGALSGMFERGHRITYICYDNEAYMNTGVQRSSATPYAAATTTTPFGRRSIGEDRPKKNLAAIAIAHDVPYVATASLAYPRDLMNKVKKSLTVDGPRFILVHSPCPVGWGFDSALTVEVSRLAVQTGLMPVYEAENGEITKVFKIIPRPVEDFLKVQRRFKHLFTSEEGREQIELIQAAANENITKMGLAKEPGRKVKVDAS